MSSASPAIGIDLGTTYSCIGVWLQKQNRVEIIKNDHGNSTTPSCVAFSDHELLVGDVAFSNAVSNPTNTIYDVKRLIGRNFSDPSVQNDIKLWPFTIVSGPNDKPNIIVKYRGVDKRFCPEEISSIVLAKMKETAETYLGCTVRNAVITVPAYFSYSQRRSTMDAGNIAALNMLRIMDEPIAAAVAYGLDNLGSTSTLKYVLVFDLGGATFDVSVLSRHNGTFKVEATAGDTHLGDKEFHKCMMNFLMEKFRKKYGKDMSGDQRSLKKLKDACETAKRNFFSQTSTTIHVDSLYDGIDFSYLMTQAQFDEVNADLYSRCMHLVEDCIKDAKIEKQSIDGVVLVGGLTRFPRVQYLLQEYFQGKRIYKHIDPEEVIAYEATVQAAKLNNQLGGKYGHQFELLHAQNLIELLTYERENTKKEVDEREVLRFELSEGQKLIEVLTTERDGARKEVEERDALHFEFWEALEHLTSERDC